MTAATGASLRALIPARPGQTSSEAPTRAARRLYHPGMRSRAVTMGAAMVLAVIAGCSSPPPSRPSARSLIVRIPGRAHPVNHGRLRAAYARQEYSCIAHGAIINLATFSSRRHQHPLAGAPARRTAPVVVTICRKGRE
jgi:hypothetical protein